ncbi:MAG TPA: glycerophosphodiester phosphodiesterase family protein, partial [Acholeplasma sp.]|nr:glycerophosphodiester phosphodiesterase family protein [Acholeplasma sp.]
VRLLSQQSIILGTVLSVMYALFLILSIVSSLFLIPINYALITVWYHKQKPLDISGQRPIVVQNNEIHFNTKLIKRALIISFIVIFGLNLSNFVSISKKRAYSEYFNSQEVIAHRGASYNAPENTISAFQAALDEGVDAIEFDVRETLDKVPIIMHDSTTSRTTNDINNSSISETTYSYLASLDAGSYFSLEFRGEKIPTLEETLDLLKDQVRVFVELKTSSITLERNTLALLDVKNMLDDAVIMSFNIDQLKRIKMNYPNVKTMLLIPIFYGSIDPILSETFIDYYGLSYQMILNYPQYIDYAHQKEKSVYAWTVNSKASITKVVQSDVDGIITDKPVLAQEITAAKNLPSFFEEILKRFNR